MNEKQFFRKIHKKIYTKQTLSRGEVNLVSFAWSNGWSIEFTLDKIAKGHGVRWEN